MRRLIKRTGRKGSYAEKRLREINREIDEERKVQANKARRAKINQKRGGARRAEWNRDKVRYTERYGTYERFKEVYDANYDEAIANGKNTRNAKFYANSAMKNSVKTKAQLNMERRRREHKGVRSEFWRFRREQGNQGSGKFSFADFIFDRYDKANGASYMVFVINEDYEYWEPISPKPGVEPFYQYVGGENAGRTEERADEKAKEMEDEEEAKKVFNEKPNDDQTDDELQKEIEETFGGVTDDRITEGVPGGTPASPDSLIPIPLSPEQSATTDGDISSTFGNGMNQHLELDEDGNPLAILSAVKTTKRRKRRRK